MAARTSSVRTPSHEGKGPVEHEDEDDEDEETRTRMRRMTTMILGCLSLVMHRFLHSSRNMYLKLPFAIYVTMTYIVSNDAYIVIVGY
jgi:hypothetical protein